MTDKPKKAVVKKAAARKFKNKTEQCQFGYWGCYDEDSDDIARPKDVSTTHHVHGCPFYVPPVDPQHAQDVAALVKERHPGVFAIPEGEHTLTCGCKMRGRAMLVPCEVHWDTMGDTGGLSIDPEQVVGYPGEQLNDPLGFAERVGLTGKDDPMPEDLTEKVMARLDKEVKSYIPILTDAEHALVEKLGSLAGEFYGVMGDDENNYRNDMQEVVFHIHALQNMVLAQAAARVYPNLYRLMGVASRHRLATKDES